MALSQKRNNARPPPSPRIVKHLFKIYIHIGFAHNAQRLGIMGLPQGQVADAGHGAAVHADGGHRYKFTQLCQVGLKILPGAAGIALAGRQVFIMIPDLMTQAGDLPDNRLNPAFRHGPEIVGCGDAQIMPQPGGFQGIAREPVHVVAQDDDPGGRSLHEFDNNAGLAPLPSVPFHGMH